MVICGECKRVLRNSGNFGLPVSLGRDHVVDAKFLRNFFDTEMQRICLKLFTGHSGEDGRRQAHQPSSFVLILISPAVLLLPLLGAVGVGCCYNECQSAEMHRPVLVLQSKLTANGRATTLVCSIIRRRWWWWRGIAPIVSSCASESAARSQRDIVGAGDALVSVRHDG